MRKFILRKIEYGQVYVADGIQIETLQCIICWRAKHARPTLWGSIDDVLKAHNCHNCTENNLEWINYA